MSAGVSRSEPRRAPRRGQPGRRPPRTDSTTASVSSCRTMPRRLAPSAQPDRHLAPPRRRAAEQQARDVGAGDREHESDRARAARAAAGSPNRKLIAQRQRRPRRAPAVLGCSRRGGRAPSRASSASGRRVTPGFSRATTRRIPRCGCRSGLPSRFRRGARHVPHGARHPQLGPAPADGRDVIVGQMKSRAITAITRRDAPLSVIVAADDRRIRAEPPRPQPVAQHDGALVGAAMERIAQQRPAPSTSKNFDDTLESRPPSSGSPPPVSVKLNWQMPAIASIDAIWSLKSTKRPGVSVCG